PNKAAGRETAVSLETKRKSRRVLWRSLFLRQRVQVAHQAFQPLLDHMGIDLGGRDVGMAEQRLYDAQVRAVMQQVAGKGMAQHVRRDQPRRQPRRRRQFLQVAGKVLPRQMSALAERGKQPLRADGGFLSL